MAYEEFTPETVEQLDIWVNCFSKVYGRRFTRNEIIIKALGSIKYVELDVADEYRKSQLRRRHITGESESTDEAIARELGINMQEYYLIKDTAGILGISLYYLDQYDKKGMIASGLKPGGNRKMYKGNEIVRLARALKNI